jgi:hypothetical protein
VRGVIVDADASWAKTLFQGSGGSLVALIGLFVVFFLTRRHEREQDRIRDERAAQRAQQQRTAESVAAVVRRTHAFRGVGAVPIPDLIDRDAISDLAEALVLLAASEIVDHPRAADWAMDRARDLVQMGIDRNCDPRAPSWEAGHVAAVLMLWLRDGANDDRFTGADEQATAQSDQDRP